MAVFWQDLAKITGIDLTDKMLVGRNADGETVYADIQQLYDILSKTQFADVKPSVISAGANLGSPSSLTVYYAPAGNYTTASGTITLTENFNLLFWDFTGWSTLSYTVAVKDNSVTTNKILDGAVTKQKLEVTLQLLVTLLSQFSSTNPEFDTNDVFQILDSLKKKLLYIDSNGKVNGQFNLQANAVNTSNVLDSAITKQKLELTLQTLLTLLSQFSATNPEFDTNSAYQILDSTKKILLEITANGKVRGQFDYSLSPIAYTDLSASMKKSVYQEFSFDPNFQDYIYVIQDSVGKIVFGIKYDGTTTIPTILFPNSVGLTELKDEVKNKFPSTQFIRQNTQNQLDLEDGFDDMWRGNQFDIPMKTSTFGIYFEPFPPIKTKNLIVINDTGTSLDIIEKKITIRGKNYVSTYNPSTDTIDPTIQKAGDFWNVINTGTLDGVSLFSGDRLIYIGRQSNAGTYTYKFVKQKIGEFFLKGEIVPSDSFSPINYDCWICSIDGTYQGIVCKSGDYLIYVGAYGRVQTNEIVLPNSQMVILNCSNSNDFAVRRTDKSTTQVTVNAKGQNTKLIRSINNNIVGYSDSMFGKNIGASISALLTDRTWSTESFGGATSDEVLTMIRKRIRETDIHAGKLHNFFHGQNNNTDLVQIKEAMFRMTSLASVQQEKFIVWSVIGSLFCTWNGTRVYINNHEDTITNPSTSWLLNIENHYDNVYQGKHFSGRKALLQKSVGRTRKHLQFPGLTESQVATTYNVPALSFWFDYSSVSWNPDTLNFVGYRSTSGLPTGGTNLDYYIRSGGGTVGTVGQIIVNISGTWIEYSHDTVHLSVEGGQAVAQKYIEFLAKLNY